LRVGYLYWIRLPEHTDITTQGYIGITGQTVTKRFNQHRNSARRSKARKKSEFKQALINGTELIVETLVISDYAYIKNLERLLRPESNIGWNKAFGGASVAESLQFSRESQKQAMRDHWKEFDHPFKFQKPWRFSQAKNNRHLWEKAPEIIEMIKSGIGDSYISKTFGEKARSTTVRTIRELYLKHEWNPLTDPEYLRDYARQEETL
jgi:hypothetical protein